MIVTRDVIEDLIPVYMAGEASADTRKLVDEFVAAHPDMLGQLSTGGLSRAPSEPSGDLGLRALAETRKWISRRNAWIAWAYALGFSVFSFVVRGNEIAFLLFRDAPLSALALLAASAFCYAMFHRICRRLVVTGLGAPHSQALWGALAAVASIPFIFVTSEYTGWVWIRLLALPAAFAGTALAKSLNQRGAGKR